MAKRRGTYEDKMHLDMPFGEALERFIGTDPREVEANIKKSKKRKPDAKTRGRSVPAKRHTRRNNAT